MTSNPKSPPSVQVNDRLSGLVGDHLGDEAAMACHRILLEAKQAYAPLSRQLLRLRQLGLRPVRAHVFAEDRLHPFRMTGAHRIAAGLWRPQPLEMHIGDATARPARQRADAWRSRACATAARHGRRSAATRPPAATRPARRRSCSPHSRWSAGQASVSRRPSAAHRPAAPDPSPACSSCRLTLRLHQVVRAASRAGCNRPWSRDRSPAPWDPDPPPARIAPTGCCPAAQAASSERQQRTTSRFTRSPSSPRSAGARCCRRAATGSRAPRCRGSARARTSGRRASPPDRW